MTIKARGLVRAVIFSVFALVQISPAQDEDFVKAELVTLSWKGKIPGLWYQTKSDVQSMDVYERGFSSPVEYVGPRVIPFYKENAVFNLPPEQRPEPVAVAKLPEGGGQLLLIFSEKTDAEDSWRIQVLDNSIKNLPAGGYRIVNLTDKPYVAAFDKTQTPVKASGITMIRPLKGDDVRDLAVQIAQDGKLVYSSTWGHQENRRATVFLLPGNPGSGLLTVRRYFQPVLPRKPEE